MMILIVCVCLMQQKRHQRADGLSLIGLTTEASLKSMRSYSCNYAYTFRIQVFKNKAADNQHSEFTSHEPRSSMTNNCVITSSSCLTWPILIQLNFYSQYFYCLVSSLFLGILVQQCRGTSCCEAACGGSLPLMIDWMIWMRCFGLGNLLKGRKSH